MTITLTLQVGRTMLLPIGKGCWEIDMTRDPMVTWTTLEPDASIIIQFRPGRSPLEGGKTEVAGNVEVKVVRAGLYPYDVVMKDNKGSRVFYDGGALDIGPRE